MTPEAVTEALERRFGAASKFAPPDAWQVEDETARLVVVQQGDWLRLMTPILPAAEAQPYVMQMLAANFDQTDNARYAISQGVVWGVVMLWFDSASEADFDRGVTKLVALRSSGVSGLFAQMMETQISQIIRAAKLQGQSLEDTMKTLDRLYSEGVMGDMGEDQGYQSQVLASWRRQLERLWPTIEVDAGSNGSASNE